jgi:hypothetical protein
MLLGESIQKQKSVPSKNQDYLKIQDLALENRKNEIQQLRSLEQSLITKLTSHLKILEDEQKQIGHIQEEASKGQSEMDLENNKKLVLDFDFFTEIDSIAKDILALGVNL